MVIGNISAGFKDGLKRMEKDSLLEEIVNYFIDNPTKKRRKHYTAIQEHLGDVEFAKYAAWNKDPATYNYNMSVTENTKVDKEADEIITFCRKVASGCKPSSLKGYGKMGNILGGVEGIKGFANRLFPGVCIDKYINKMPKPIQKGELIPTYMLKYLKHRDDHLGSFI